MNIPQGNMPMHQILSALVWAQADLKTYIFVKN